MHFFPFFLPTDFSFKKRKTMKVNFFSVISFKTLNFHVLYICYTLGETFHAFCFHLDYGLQLMKMIKSRIKNH